MIKPIIIHSEDQTNNSSLPLEQAVDDDKEDPLKTSVLPTENISSLVSPGGSTFDYLYEFSETRKVLEEFFKCPAPSEEKDNNTDSFAFQVLFFILMI